MKAEQKAMLTAIRVGIIFYPIFFILDLIIYPDYKFTFLMIRIIVVLSFIIMNFVLFRVNEKYVKVLMIIGVSIGAFSISLMCFLSKEGFASPYFTGNMLILIVTSVFFRIKFRYYILLLSIILIQHFILLLFIPFQVKGISINIFFLGGAALICMFVHYCVHKLNEEINHQANIIKQKNKEKTNYFINLAHETKTPLTLISNYLQKYIKKTGIDSDLAIIKDNFEKLKKNMINFLDHEKLEKGQDFYDHGDITDLSTTLQNSINLFKETANQKQIQINSNVEGNISVMADPYAINRIINNLLDNALKFTNKGGSMEISLIGKRNIIELMVKDSGIGMKEEQLVHIFKSYYQISHEKRNIQGIGMGLNIVKKIIDDIGAKIEVTSTPGRGTEFRIHFKGLTGIQKKERGLAVNETGYTIESAYKDIPADPLEKANKKTILIVEDNLDMLVYLHEALQEIYNIFCVQNGKQALQKLASMKKIHLVVSDIMMDTMNGYEFYEEFKKQEEYKAVPVIFLTAKNTQVEKIKALQRGAVDFINKPFNIEELKAKINSIIKISEFQFKQNKQELIKQVIDSLDSSISKDDFSLLFEKKCRQYDISEREMEIMILLFKGIQYKDIADQLFVSTNTIRTHIRKIYEKCKVNNKLELMKLFKRQ